MQRTTRITLIGDVGEVPQHEHEEKSQTTRGDPRSVAEEHPELKRGDVFELVQEWLRLEDDLAH